MKEEIDNQKEKANKTERGHLLAIRLGKKNEIFGFKTKHDRAMALDAMVTRKPDLEWSVATVGKGEII